MITLLDYGAGNVRSVVNAVERLGEQVRMVERPEDITAAQRLLFPGVGSFGSMMSILNQKNYAAPLREYLGSGRPFLGICLGLQALFDCSDEAPGVEGLGVIPGRVRRFDTKLAVPHIGWNGLRQKKPSRLLAGLADEERYYFVHSYHVVPSDPGCVLTVTDYGTEFVSSIAQGPLVATQFHPEKSGRAGLVLLKNFIETPSAAKPAGFGRPTRLAKRIIACLDVRTNDQGDLVVTKGDRYDVRENGRVRNLGKPVELAQRYYEQGADEITFLNITGFRDFPLEDMPMLEVLRQTSRRVFVPLTIGGGIRDYTDVNGRFYSALAVADTYFRSGADKISIGSDAVDIVEDYLKTGVPSGKSAIETISRVYGSQAVVISIDPRRVYVTDPQKTPQSVIATQTPGPNGERYCWFQCTVKGGREGRAVDAVTLARVCEVLGAGEILLNSIDRDGTNIGFDIELVQAVKNAVSIPVIASSGAGRPDHFYALFTRSGADAALAAGIFHRNEVSIDTVKAYLENRLPVRRQPV